VPYGNYFDVKVTAKFDEKVTFSVTHFGLIKDQKTWLGEDKFKCDKFLGTKIITFELKGPDGNSLGESTVRVKCVGHVEVRCNPVKVSKIEEKYQFNEEFVVTFTMQEDPPRMMRIEKPGIAFATSTTQIKLKCDKVNKLVPIEVWQTAVDDSKAPDGYTLCLNQTRKVCCYKDANTKCDPHFTTFSGEKYDYHGECDLVVLHNPKYKNGLGMYVHVRTKIETFYSYIHTAVLQIGQETFEVTGAPYNQVWLNGIPGVEFPARISGHAIGHRQIGEHQHRYNIILGQGNGEHIEISTYKHFVGVSVKQATSESFNGSMGLLGSFETGHKVARDGSTIINHTNDFGQEWQVLPTDPHLFRNLEGPQSPEMCLLPTISSKDSRNLRADGISLEQAHAACARVSSDEYDNCVST